MAKSFGETHPRNLNATCKCEHWQSCIGCHPTAHTEKYVTDAMKVRQAVSEAVLAHQEPVAYQQRTRPNWKDATCWTPWEDCSKAEAQDCWDRPQVHDWLDEARALYTTPPQRKPLTDEEIILIVADCASSHQHTDIHFARAIEAAHGIKGLI